MKKYLLILEDNEKNPVGVLVISSDKDFEDINTAFNEAMVTNDWNVNAITDNAYYVLKDTYCNLFDDKPLIKFNSENFLMQFCNTIKGTKNVETNYMVLEEELVNDIILHEPHDEIIIKSYPDYDPEDDYEFSGFDDD